MNEAYSLYSARPLFLFNLCCVLVVYPVIIRSVSSRSHNFRPSYFRLGSILMEQMKVPCVLAMTATATKKAERSIMEALRIPDAGVVQAPRVRDNLVLTVSQESNRLVDQSQP